MIGIEKYLLVKVKGIVTFKAGVEVEKAWYTDLPFLVHNVGEGGNRSAIACSDALVLHLDVLLVSKTRSEGFLLSVNIPTMALREYLCK